MHRRLRSRPYCTDREGNSTTRAFVEAFLEQWASPTHETYTTSQGKKDIMVGRGIYDQVFHPSTYPRDPIYDRKAYNPLERHIGRASRSGPSGNTQEFLWCCIADICLAVQTLSERHRRMLTFLYVEDLAVDEFCGDFGKSARSVKLEVQKAISQIVEVLDGTFIYP